MKLTQLTLRELFWLVLVAAGLCWDGLNDSSVWCAERTLRAVER